MTWNAFHHRGQILADVITAANDRLDGLLPADITGVSDAFEDDVDLVGALSLKWHARLSGNVERALAREPLDLPAAVAGAWRTTATQLPGVRLVLDRAAAVPVDPRMAQATNRMVRAERARLAQAAGLATTASDAAVSAGARIEEQARAGLSLSRPEAVPVTTSPERGATRESFVRRIKAVLAA